MLRLVNSKKTARRTGPVLALSFALIAPFVLSACNSTSEVLSHGYQLNEDSLALIPEGSSRDQVLLTLGTPSTTQGQPGSGETFYYISQKKSRSVAFQRPSVVDQRVLAIYMGADDTVDQIANYGLKDGKVFDFVARVTPTGGKDLSFIGQILAGGGRGLNPFGG